MIETGGTSRGQNVVSSNHQDEGTLSREAMQFPARDFFGGFWLFPDLVGRAVAWLRSRGVVDTDVEFCHGTHNHVHHQILSTITGLMAAKTLLSCPSSSLSHQDAAYSWPSLRHKMGHSRTISPSSGHGQCSLQFPRKNAEDRFFSHFQCFVSPYLGTAIHSSLSMNQRHLTNIHKPSQLLPISFSTHQIHVAIAHPS